MLPTQESPHDAIAKLEAEMERLTETLRLELVRSQAQLRREMAEEKVASIKLLAGTIMILMVTFSWLLAFVVSL